MHTTASALKWPALLALFAGTFVMSWRLSGASPVVCKDTIEDERFIETCLGRDVCTMKGMGSSLGTVRHGANWLHFRTLAQQVGVGVSEVHVVMHLADALAVVLLAVMAAELAGAYAGVLAALLFLLGLSWLDTSAQVLNNSRALPLLGVIVLTASWRAVESGSLLLLGLAAVATAALTNTHLCGATTFVALVGVALLRPGRWWVSLLVAGGVGGAALFLGSLQTWLDITEMVFQSRALPTQGRVLGSFLISPFQWLGYAGSALVALMLLLTPERRRALGALLCLTAIPLGLYALAQSTVQMDRTDKYLIQLAGPVAAAGGVGALLLLRWSWSLVWRARPPLLPRVARALRETAPFAAAAGICFLPSTDYLVEREPDRLPRPTFAEVGEVMKLLRGELRWTIDHILRGLKGPLDYELLRMMKLPPPSAGPSADEDDTAALVLKVRRRSLPSPLPEGWRVVAQGDRYALLVVLWKTWLDWRTFEVCAPPAPCAATGLRTDRIRLLDTSVAGMPPFGGALPAFELRIPVVIPPRAETRQLWSPVLVNRCAGRFTAVPTGSAITSDARSAVLRNEGAEPLRGVVAIEYQPGRDDCSIWGYTGYPPFFFEGAHDTISALERIFADLREPG